MAVSMATAEVTAGVEVTAIRDTYQRLLCR